MAANHTFASLPEDLIIDILQFLPFDSLLNWKLVSKKWRDVINDFTFSNRYRNKSISVFVKGKSICCAIVRPTYTFDRCPPPYTMHRLPMDLPDIEDSQFFFPTLISASSTGIACVLAGNGRLYFYNLFTGVPRRVKNPPMSRREIFTSLRYGSGYDSSDDEYKLMLVSRPDKDSKELQCPFWIYSFRNSTWESFDCFPYASYGWLDHTCVQREAYSFNGVLHWLSSRDEGGVNNSVIVTYDLHTREFGEIWVPNSAKFGKLTELDGRLCCIYRRCTDSIEWVMDRFSVGGYWTTLFSFDPLKIETAFYVNQIVYTELYEGRDGSKVVSFLMFGEDEPRMISYNINKDKIKIIHSTEFRRNWDVILRQKLAKLEAPDAPGGSTSENKLDGATNRQKCKTKAPNHGEHKGENKADGATNRQKGKTKAPNHGEHKGKGR